MKTFNQILTLNLFWIPIIIGGVLATLLFGSVSDGGTSVLGFGPFLDSLIAVILIFIGVYALIKIPGNIWRFIIGFGLIGFGLYMLIIVIGVV